MSSNPFPSVPLHQKDQSDYRKWVDRQIEQVHYDDLPAAMKDIMKLCRGRMNPQYIIDAWNNK